ncbi:MULTISPECIES: DHA2 family efflux MFS transporter permease subunit [unclassified Caballeronia]|jgi:EmrB/QacA subfamily drug resistance transporter|uniref:DHA2 family efflux MFS transporter permease subunit n=1 Tax=Caballeronia sp. TF1N1 TaxID=2878153 RepID=UPI002541DA60|nr:MULTISPECIES: DHA2 family efflux MFS transporter permease subunit [unclassified Caballeronia]
MQRASTHCIVNDGNFRITAAVVASALFMQNMDGTIVATAIPTMARDLHIDPVHLSSAITAYLVALTVFIPASGWVADRFGARRVFMWAIATFTLASIACAAAANLPQLIGARIVQGLGGAMMVPVGRLILFRGVKREELLQATTWLTMPALVGPLLGPPLGGFLTDALSWRSIFWVNVPVGAIGLVLTWKLLPPSPPESRTPPDLRGMLLSGTSLSLFMIGIESAGRGVMPEGLPWACVAVGLLLFWATVVHCRRVENPAIDFSLLAIPTFHAATVAGSLFRAGAGALPFLVPLTLQTGFGYSASASGLVTFASALGSFCMRPMTALALRRFSVRAVLCAGSVIFALVLVVCSTMSQAWPAAAIFVLLLVGGLGRSLSFATMGALAFADVPKPRLAAATSFQGTAQQLMKALGVTVAAGTIQATMLISGSVQTERWQLASAFLATAAVVLMSLPMFARLSDEAGAGISAPTAKRAERT